MEQFERIRRDHRQEGLSIRALARRHHVHRRVVRQALISAIPPSRRTSVRAKPVFGPYEGVVRQWLVEDLSAPKKQRHTARRIHKRLVVEYGADIGESTVRGHVHRLRAQVQPPPEAMVPQVHLPGEEAEVDFAELWVHLGGELTKVWLFSLRLSASGRACHRVFATQAQEAFLAGHVRAFERLGGVPGRIRYDNLKPAVLRVLMGRDRIESERFVAFRSHYGFDSFYCRPGRQGAHEKGGVEGDLGWFRRNHLVPVPRARTLTEVNDLVEAGDDEDLSHVISGRRTTIGQDFAAERPLLRSLPPEPFDTARHLSVRVDPKSRVCVRQCFYSVPASLVARRLEVALGAEEVAVFDGAHLVARHQRLVRRGAQSLVLDHYLETLVKKPGALASSTPLAQARANGHFSPLHQAFWDEARRRLGDAQGTGARIEVLLLARTIPAERLAAGLRRALGLGVLSADLVALEATRMGSDAWRGSPWVTGPGHFERPAPDLSSYDQLLAGVSS